MRVCSNGFRAQWTWIWVCSTVVVESLIVMLTVLTEWTKVKNRLEVVATGLRRVTDVEIVNTCS